MKRAKRKGAYGRVNEAPKSKREWEFWRRGVFARSVGYAAALKWMRKDAGVTQGELARELGLSVATIMSRESGKTLFMNRRGTRIVSAEQVIMQTARALARIARPKGERA